MKKVDREVMLGHQRRSEARVRNTRARAEFRKTRIATEVARIIRPRVLPPVSKPAPWWATLGRRVARWAGFAKEMA